MATAQINDFNEISVQIFKITTEKLNCNGLVAEDNKRSKSSEKLFCSSIRRDTTHITHYRIFIQNDKRSESLSADFCSSSHHELPHVEHYHLFVENRQSNR